MLAEKKARINVRVTAEQRDLLREAAETSGETVTTFLLHDALDRARRVVETHRVTTIRDEVTAAFDAWLERPPAVLPDAERLSAAEPFEQRT